MIVFGEMHESELIALPLQEFPGRLEQPGITLEFALMIACSEARIIDEEFLLVLNRIELTFRAAICDQNAFVGHTLIPMGKHL